MQIWEEQLKIDFDDPPEWQTIKNDLGPHLSRLPEELLPAIGKFLIIAKDKIQNEVRSDTKLQYSLMIFYNFFYFEFF